MHTQLWYWTFCAHLKLLYSGNPKSDHFKTEIKQKMDIFLSSFEMECYVLPYLNKEHKCEGTFIYKDHSGPACDMLYNTLL